MGLIKGMKFILRRSEDEARKEILRHFSRVRDVCRELANGEITRAQAVERLRGALAQMETTNPVTAKRLEMVTKTLRRMAGNLALAESQTEEELEQYPAWHFTRVSPRRVPRTDWPARWAAAGAECNFEGASRESFIALKDSPIWAALGSGAGGFKDATGSAVPPFAYGSGMGWVKAKRAECIASGLIKGNV